MLPIWGVGCRVWSRKKFPVEGFKVLWTLLRAKRPREVTSKSVHAEVLRPRSVFPKSPEEKKDQVRFGGNQTRRHVEASYCCYYYYYDLVRLSEGASVLNMKCFSCTVSLDRRPRACFTLWRRRAAPIPSSPGTKTLQSSLTAFHRTWEFMSS